MVSRVSKTRKARRGGTKKKQWWHCRVIVPGMASKLLDQPTFNPDKPPRKHLGPPYWHSAKTK